MRVIEYDAAIGALKGLLAEETKRAMLEASYLHALCHADVPTDGALYRRHHKLQQYYAGRRDSIQNAITRLDGLNFEVTTEVVNEHK